MRSKRNIYKKVRNQVILLERQIKYISDVYQK